MKRRMRNAIPAAGARGAGAPGIQEFVQILAPGERVEHAYQLIRDYFVFTDKRFVLVDKQGLTGSKVDYHSLANCSDG